MRHARAHRRLRGAVPAALLLSAPAEGVGLDAGGRPAALLEAVVDPPAGVLAAGGQGGRGGGGGEEQEEQAGRGHGGGAGGGRLPSQGSAASGWQTPCETQMTTRCGVEGGGRVVVTQVVRAWSLEEANCAQVAEHYMAIMGHCALVVSMYAVQGT